MSFVLQGYRVNQQVGTGAGSRIYAGVKIDTNEPVAIKRIIRKSSDDDIYLQQVENEYTVSNRIKSKYIRHSYELHKLRKRLQIRELVLVMEYVDGLSVEDARPNRLNTFLKVAARAAAGLHAMHEHGYIHTDIKPSNVMIVRGGAVKLIDFGQSCTIGFKKERIQGTPDYIAPEQVRKMPLDQRTDVFNLGATMYWLLTSECYPTALGERPRGEAITFVPSDKPIEPIELNDKIPRSLSNLVMECCRDNPAERPADMRILIARLENIRQLWKKQLGSMRAKS